MNRLIITKLSQNNKQQASSYASCSYASLETPSEKGVFSETPLVSAFFSEQELLEITIIHPNQKTLLGNIYLGKVKNIIKNIRGAFVEIEDGTMCYLSLEENASAIFANQKKDTRILIGDEIFVQVNRENVKTKNPTVTIHFNLTGKYVVLTHGKTQIGVSTKIKNQKDRKRLRTLVEPFENEQWGIIVRTNAIYATEEEIQNEIILLKNQYDTLCKTGIHKKSFSLLYKAPASYLCDIRDSYMDSIDEIITDDAPLLNEIKDYLKDTPDEKKIRFYEDPLLSLSNLYSIHQKLKKALEKRVWLKSGGYLVIEPTEALTVIDVNTGKAIEGKKKAEETFFKINKEAAIEIAYQLRLRNLSGIIIVDFIDMQQETHKQEIMKLLEEAFQKDSVKTVLVDMTALNLVEITRKKIRKPLYEQITSTMLQT